MMETRPVAAYMLALVGVALQGVAALFVLYMVVFFSASVTTWREINSEHMMPWMMGRWMGGYPYTYHPLWSFIWLISAVIVIALGVYGAVLMNSTQVGRVRMGATLVLIASIIAFPTMWGFMIGSLLMFVGSILGLTWVPPKAQQVSQS
jgi:hypothetical protein